MHLKTKSHFNYSKFGYIFIAPFFLTYALFSLYPLIYTFYISNFKEKSIKKGESHLVYNGLQNFQDLLFSSKNFNANAMHEALMQALKNTFSIWIFNFVPQILLALLLAAWFTDLRLKIKAKGFFKIVVYMPNIITAASISILFLSLFNETEFGPVNGFLMKMNLIKEPVLFLTDAVIKRGIISFILFWMWYGNTMIIFIAAIMGINPSIIESAQIDGATSGQMFRKITLPLIKPIMLFTLVTSMIGGLQNFDVPLLFNKEGPADPKTKTIAIFIFERFTGTLKNYGTSAAASVILFFITAILSIVLFTILRDKDAAKEKKNLKRARRGGF